MCDENSRAAQARDGDRILRDPSGKHPDVYLDKDMTADEVNRIHRSAAKTPPKFTAGKPKFELIFPDALLELAKIRTAGAKVHGPDSWAEIKDTDIIGAIHRHLNKIQRCAKIDEDSTFYHAAHIMCQAMFLYQNHLDRVTDEDEDMRIEDLMQDTSRYHR